MTHGEEPGPETHTDSAVLTYLEGLLMHPVAAGPGATATRRAEAGHVNQDQGNKAGRPFQMPSHGPAIPKVGSGPSLGASKNLKKARLLRSGGWNEPGSQRLSSPPAEQNGQGGVGVQNGTMEGSPHAGESTLLASLLQSFSSRLQSVALSQHSAKPPGERSPPLPPEALPPAEKEAPPCYGTASSRLKGLMKKSKLQSHGGTPYSRRGHGPERPAESPRSTHGSTPPAASGDSCAERLKAVANLVKIRSSPAPSPKPSVACSQLALLLSSEAHLQQYSREHAVKAQLSGRSASERLAAMATQQDKRPPSVDETGARAPDPLISMASHNGTATTATTTAPHLASNSSQRSPSLLQRQSSPRPTPPLPPLPSLPPAALQGSSHGHNQAPREKRGFDVRPARPPQTCSSLLLLLLNNHNSQRQLTKNGHMEDDCGVLPPSRGSSVTSDSECSTQERSLTKVSSDAESSYSSCSPIDLSMRGRASTKATVPKPPTSLSSMAFSSSSSSSAVFSSAPLTFSPTSSAPPTSSSAFSSSSTLISSASTSFSSSLSSSTFSLDRLTESLINKWKPEASGPKLSQGKELEGSPDLKHHSKVTLMQLLLERRNNDKVNKLPVNPELTHTVAQARMSRGPLKGPLPWEEMRTESPLDMGGPPVALPLFPASRDPGSTPSPFSYPSSHVQSSPLDLCKSKAYPVEKAPEPAFSASKLLQNLAQCGTASPSPPMASIKGPATELDVGRPLALLERLNAPLQRTPTSTPLSDGPSASTMPFGRQEASPLSSQIENLLERRTVLQLLLGTGPAAPAAVSRTHRSVGSGRRSVEVGGGQERPRGTSVICDISKEPLADVKVKTEPPEEQGSLSAACEEASSRKRFSPHTDPQQDLKSEPRPAEVIAKYGLLSQLLKQQTATYYTSAVVQSEPRPSLVKEERREYQGPSPKKRRFCPELADSLNNGSPPRAPDSRASSSSLASAPQEEVRPHRLKSPKEEVVARSPPEEALPRESRGFNVLKQLLLSDNCLKELSQQPHGPTSSPSVLQANGKANGSLLNQPAYNHDLLHLPWQPHSSFSSGPPNHLRPLPTPPTLDFHRQSPWGRQADLHTDSPSRDSPAQVKREPVSPVRWYREEEDKDEGCDSSPDSPRLTRSNPILYYMLQKGSAQLRRDMREEAEGAQSGVKVKEEPVADMHAYEHRLSSTQHSPHNDKHSHKSQRLSQSSDKW